MFSHIVACNFILFALFILPFLMMLHNSSTIMADFSVFFISGIFSIIAQSCEVNSSLLLNFFLILFKCASPFNFFISQKIGLCVVVPIRFSLSSFFSDNAIIKL